MLDIYLLGAMKISHKDVVLPPLPTQKAVSLFGYLIANAGLKLSREFLAELFWPNHPPEHARRSLHTALWHIRNLLKEADLHPDQYLSSSKNTIFWQEKMDYWVDAREFEATIKEGSRTSLEKAISLYRRPFMADLYDEWVIEERNRLETKYLQVLLLLISQDLASKNYSAALEKGWLATKTDPFNENAHQGIIYALYQLGNRSGAIEHYKVFSKLLISELDIAPSEEIRSLYEGVLQETLPRQIQILHKSEEESLESAVVLKSAPPVKPLAESLFFGRINDLRSLHHWWTEQHEVCALITGEPGVGKTHLAREFAEHLQTEGVLVAWGRCLPLGDELPYPEIRSLLIGLYANLPEELRIKIPPWISKELAGLAPETVDADQNTDLSLAMSLDARYLFKAISDLITYLRKYSSILIVVDDLHWASDTTIKLLEYLTQVIETSFTRHSYRVCILAIASGEIALSCNELTQALFRLRQHGLLQDIKIGNLTREAVVIWIAHLSRSIAHGEKFGERLFAHTDGNPFMITETVKTLFTSGALEEGESGWTGPALTSVDFVLPIPTSIRDLVKGWINSLAPVSAEVLFTAAVAGRHIRTQTILKVLDHPQNEVLAAIDDLLRTNLLREPEQPCPYDIEFTHPLIHRAIYNQIPPYRRANIQDRIGSTQTSE